MEAVELAELDLDAVAAIADRQRQLDVEPPERVFEIVEFDRDHLAAGQIVAGLEAAGGAPALKSPSTAMRTGRLAAQAGAAASSVPKSGVQSSSAMLAP